MIHILIVDDNEDSRMILKKTLELEEHIVETAINGEEALKIARKSSPDMIISDILMPVMDGFQLCIKCKTDDGLKDIPFVFYTATYTDEKDEEAALKMGAAGFIRKPVEPDEFIKIIQVVIGDAEKGRIMSGKPSVKEEKDVLKLYSECLINKLEKKMLDLEREVATRKQAEEVLRKSEKRFMETADLLPQTVYETDERENIIFVNRNALDVFGYTQEDFDKGLTALQMIAPEDRDISKENIQKVLSGEKLDGIEYMARRKNGSSFPVIVYSRSIISDDKVIGIRGIIVDITERKQAEAVVRESEIRYRTIFEGVAEGIIIADFETKEIRYANPAICRILGYTEKEMKNLGVRGIHSKTDYDRVISRFKAQKREGINLVQDIPFLHKDGTIIDADINTTRVVIDGRECNVGCVTDITERKRAAEKLWKRTFDLGQRVRELSCLFEITALFGKPGISFEEILQSIAGLVLLALQYPETACARIIVDKEEFKTANFEETKWRLFSDIIVDDKSFGSIEVCYLKESQESGEDPFLKEEELLIHTVAERIGKIVKRIRTEKELEQSYEKLQGALYGTINVLAATSEWRDPYTAGHQKRVAQLAFAIAEEMNLPEEQIENIQLSAIIHDIGKINIPSEILSKPGRLSNTEFKLIQTHPQVGYDILKGIEFLWPIANTVLQHHEKMNGSGYPNGLSGEEICLEARILAVADVVEAMASHRPYRPAVGIDAALKEIEDNRGILYDAEVVDFCLSLFNGKGFAFS